MCARARVITHFSSFYEQKLNTKPTIKRANITSDSCFYVYNIIYCTRARVNLTALVALIIIYQNVH